MVDVHTGTTPLLRQAIERLSGGPDAPPCDSLFDADVRWHEPGRSLVAGDYEGCDEVVGLLFGRLRDLSDGTFGVARWESTTSDGERETGIYVVRARRNGRDLLSRVVCVAEIRAGAIASVQVFHADQHAWDRFWA